METTTRSDAAPEFAAAMRGYDRSQVDEYVARLGRWMEEARMRVEAAEAHVHDAHRENAELRKQLAEVRHTGPSPAVAMDGVGERVEKLVHAALEECEGIRRQAREEAESVVTMARRTAVEIVSAARSTVAGMEQAADEDRRRAADAHGQAAARADATVSERMAAVEEDAAARMRQATEEAAAVQADAERRRARILEAAEQHRRAAEAEVARLVRQRDQVLGQLTNMRAALEGAIALPPGDGGEVATVVDLRPVESAER